ncbi:MAG TPA: type II toxin-antitoxin system VapC family toxin [Acidimicrobiales bacterium]|nr:type II toxin-antitoxin system VapC family toxin [Acidimicrobiales bacterium]
MSHQQPTPVVLDGSALVALLGDAGPAGTWVEAAISGAALAAPELAVFEAANILRRQMISGPLDASQATLAHADLVALPLQLWPYAPLSERAWELRHNLTIYDASYVALAELLGAPVVTLDAKLRRAPGLRCPILAYVDGYRHTLRPDF